MIQINNELRDRAYKCACDHGFHDKEYPTEHWLMLIITEISVAIEADRKNKHSDAEHFKKRLKYSTIYKNSVSDETKESIFKMWFNEDIKDSVDDELSDIVIRCLDFAGLKKINVEGRIILSYVVTKKKSFI